MSKKPIKECSKPIGNSVTAVTKVYNTKNGQVAIVDFMYEKESYYTANLSSQTSTASKSFDINKGKASVTLNFQAESGFTPGTLNAEGWVTDQQGENKQSFDRQICSWSN